MKKTLLLVTVLFIPVFFIVQASVQGQQSKKDKVRLTGTALQKMHSEYYATAGLNPTNGCVWMVVNFGGGAKEQFWHCRAWGSGSSKGTAQVVGDQLCNKWEKINSGQEQCWEIYRIDETKYEAWRDGKFQMSYYRLK